MVQLTPVAITKVKEILSQQTPMPTGLRVAVVGGGCSGFQYALAFDDQRDEDTVFEDKGIRLLVDNASLPYVKGSVIDFRAWQMMPQRRRAQLSCGGWTSHQSSFEFCQSTDQRAALFWRPASSWCCPTHHRDWRRRLNFCAGPTG